LKAQTLQKIIGWRTVSPTRFDSRISSVATPGTDRYDLAPYEASRVLAQT
jgi:hypothetical protein